MVPSWNGDGEEVQEGDLHNTKTQMRLFNAIATAAVVGTSFIAANPAEARTCITLYNGGNNVGLHSVYSDRGAQKTVVVSVNGGFPSRLTSTACVPRGKMVPFLTELALTIPWFATK